MTLKITSRLIAIVGQTLLLMLFAKTRMDFIYAGF